MAMRPAPAPPTPPCHRGAMAETVEALRAALAWGGGRGRLGVAAFRSCAILAAQQAPLPAWLEVHRAARSLSARAARTAHPREGGSLTPCGIGGAHRERESESGRAEEDRDAGREGEERLAGRGEEGQAGGMRPPLLGSASVDSGALGEARRARAVGPGCPHCTVRPRGRGLRCGLGLLRVLSPRGTRPEQSTDAHSHARQRPPCVLEHRPAPSCEGLF